MAYARWNECKWYIYGTQEGIKFNDMFIPDEAIDIFIYKLYDEKNNGGEDFWERYNHGKGIIEKSKETIENFSPEKNIGKPKGIGNK